PGKITEAMSAMLSSSPNVIICDLDAPLEDERRLTQFLRERSFSIPMLAIVSHLDIGTFLHGQQEGIRGWIHRDFVTVLLPAGIRGVVRDGLWLDPGCTRLFRDDLNSLVTRSADQERRLARYEGPLAPLTDREREILQAMMEDLSTKEIAARHHVSPSTIQGHVTKILGKLGVETRNQAVQRARKLGVS